MSFELAAFGSGAHNLERFRRRVCKGRYTTMRLVVSSLGLGDSRQDDTL
jgi:hypothetical protein